MKKHIIILTALAGICMTGCGTADISGSESLTAVIVTEPVDAYSDTANTDGLSEITDASEIECTYSVAELVGEWSAPDTFGMNNTTMTIQSDGTFYVKYAAGGTRTGKVSVEQVEGIDYYSFCEDSAEPWMRYACGDQPVNQLNTQQADGINFVRISLDDVVI